VRAETAKTRGLNRCFNRTLKYVFKGAATTVITSVAPGGQPSVAYFGSYVPLQDEEVEPGSAKIPKSARHEAW
jgi:hypothetical protein